MARQPRVSRWRLAARSRLFRVLALALVLIIAVSFGREYLRRRDAYDEMAKLKRELAVLEEKRTNLANLIDYFQSPLFQEQEAREKLGLAKPGESVVVVPLKASGSSSELLIDGREVDTESREPNPTKWWQYFFSPPSEKNS